MKDNLIKFPEWKRNYEEMVQYLEDAHGAENIIVEKVFDAEGNFSGMTIGIKGIHF